MRHPLLLDQERNQVEFDPKKRFLFLDIDGVLNPLNYEQNYVGPKLTGMWDPNYNRREHWEIIELELDPAVTFPVDRDYKFEIDTWMEYSADWIESMEKNEANAARRFRKINIHASSELLTEITALAAKHDLQIAYLTFWKSESLRLVEPELNLGAIGYLDWFSQSDLGVDRKIWSLVDFFKETEIKRPFAFLDDQANRHYDSPDATLFGSESMEYESVPRVLLNVKPELGITRENLRRLDEFFTLNP